MLVGAVVLVGVRVDVTVGGKVAVSVAVSVIAPVTSAVGAMTAWTFCTPSGTRWITSPAWTQSDGVTVSTVTSTPGAATVPPTIVSSVPLS